MNGKSKVAIGIIVLLIIALALFSLFYGNLGKFLDDAFGIRVGGAGESEENCFPLEGAGFNQDENGSYIAPESLTCYSGVWVNLSKKPGDTEIYCEAYYSLINVTYTDNDPLVMVTDAQGDEFCENGEIIESPGSCGDFLCSPDETETNCWVDCGPIQSWEDMKAESQRPELATFLESEGIFAYNYPEIEELAKEVEASEPATPFDAVKKLTRLISRKVDYVRGGVSGNKLCGETSDIILERGYGNCIDYSAIMIATLRRGFDIPSVGRVSIPSRQVAGCLSGRGTWRAVEYNIFDDKAGLHGEILGHSWTEVYVGEDRWNMADPTTNTALVKTYFGYYPIEYAVDNDLCTVPIESEAFCEMVSDG